MAIMLLAFQVTFSQVDDQTVELDEVVLSLPFNQTLGKSVIKVDKINFNDLNPILQQYISKSISKLPGVSILSTGPGVSKPSIRGLSYDRVVVYSQGVRLENQQWGDEHGIGVSTSGINSVEVSKDLVTCYMEVMQWVESFTLNLRDTLMIFLSIIWGFTTPIIMG